MDYFGAEVAQTLRCSIELVSMIQLFVVRIKTIPKTIYRFDSLQNDRHLSLVLAKNYRQVTSDPTK